jgi:hypothetical protein
VMGTASLSVADPRENVRIVADLPGPCESYGLKSREPVEFSNC